MLWPRLVALLPQPLLLWLIITALATWRVTSILHHEKIAKPIRTLIGVRELEEIRTGEITRYYPDHFLGQMFDCFMCLSVWCAVLMLVVLYLFPILLLPLAISAVAIFLQVAVFES